jgi:transcriptional regulator with XRE-family HTH domain
VSKGNKEYREAFGQHIKTLREERGWSQKQLEAVSDLEVSHISSIENGRYAVTLNTILSLAVALGKYPDELFKFDFNLRLNTDFKVQDRKRRSPGTTKALDGLAEGSFFTTPKRVNDVVHHLANEEKIVVQSSIVSAALKRLVDGKRLKRISSAEKKGMFLYQKRLK